MPRVHVRAGADIAMEPAASAVAECGAEGAPQGERAEVAGPVLGEDAAQGPGCPRGRGGRREGKEEEVPLRLRLGRARRRAGPGTPPPSWKLEASPGSPDREGEVEMAAAAAPAPRRSSASASASARQLGASLWEIHDVTRREGRRSEGRRHRSGNGTSGVGVDVDKPQSSGGSDRNLTDSSKNLHKLHQGRSHAVQPFSPASYTSSTRGSNIDRAINQGLALDVKSRSRVAGYNLNTSTELLKVLNRIWSLEEQQTANMSVVKGLKLELHQALAHIQELKQERRGYRHEVASLMRQLSEDKLVRKSKNREKIKGALCSLQDEVEDERHLRWHSEDLHRKSGRELSEIKPAFLKAIKDLEKEKKTNSLLEDLCDQFALGIRNYEEEVSMLKQRHANYEHKFDKSVLHISEAWLDERMQMQNIDVQEDLLPKATVTERLSSEIEAFLLAKESASSKNNVKFMNNTRQDSSLRRQSRESVHLNGTTSAPQVAEDDDDDSVASDLHCFELNMHGNGNRNHHHTGLHRSGTASMDESKRISGYCYCTAGESSHMSRVPIYAQKDKARSSSSNPHYVTRTLEINSRSSAEIAPADVSYTNMSRGSHIDALNHNLEARPTDCLGQESLDHYSRTSLFCEGTNSGDLCNPHSPAQQQNYQSTPSGREIFECSPELPVGVKENTLKAKLLQARLEGRHARLRTTGGSLSSRRK